MAIFIAITTITVTTAQTGSNYGNPCLNVRKGPNTLKTKKHVPYTAHSRFNAHNRANGNGNAHPYTSQVNHPLHHINKNHVQPAAKMNRMPRKKARHRDRGDKQ